LKKIFFYSILILVLSMIAMPAFAASSPGRLMIKISGKNYLQVRGVDKPHGYTSFNSWPGYTSFVHSNCHHVHGEFKTLDSKGREVYSKGVSIPLYCKGATKYISKAFKYAAEELGLSATKFLKVGGWFVVLITSIPSVGGGGETVCNQNATTNSTYCYWVEY
jgi:hypothetical protein